MSRRESVHTGRTPAGLFVGAGAFLLVLAVLLASSLSRRAPPTYVPTPVGAVPTGTALVGPRLVTIDARANDRWHYFSFADGSVVERPGPRDWDLAFRRFQVIANGGAGFGGDGGISDLGDVAFDAVTAVPDSGYVQTRVRSDSVNVAARKWYDYSFLSHLLSPKPRVYAVRTADGRFAKLQFVGYYCPGAAPGCITFRYVYQGGGGTDVAAAVDENVGAAASRGVR